MPDNKLILDNTNSNNELALFEQHKGQIKIQLDRKGMVQVHVKNYELANQLTKCIKNNKSLKNVDSSSDEITQVDGHYKFCLTKPQYDIIFGQGSYQQLKFVKELTQRDISELFSAAEISNHSDFIQLIMQHHPKALNKILFEKKGGLYFLGYIAWKQSEQALTMLVNNATTPIINEVILQQNYTRCNTLYLVAQYQSEKSLMTLINKADAASVSSAICMQDNSRWNPLHIAACYQSEKAFAALLDKATPESLHIAISQKCRNGTTPFSIAARYQSPKAFVHLMNKLDDVTINQAIINEKYFLFSGILEFQPIHVLCELLKKLYPETLNASLTYLTNSAALSLFRKVTHYPDLACEIIAKLNNDSASYLLEKIQDYTKNGLPLIPSMLLVKRIKDKFKSSSCQIKSFKTSKGENIDFNDANLIEIIKRDGFYSYDDAAMLLAAYEHKNHQQLINVIEELNAQHLLLKGGLVTHPPLRLLETNIQEKITNHEILYKIIKPSFFESYIAQFKDYQVRPKNIRHSKPYAAYKFQHLTGEITPYQPNHSHPCNKKTIKKNSTTLLSSELITPVFGENHNDGRPLVGLIFDLKQCNIKAMLKYDIGTVNHGWLGTIDEVKRYKQSLSNLNYTDFNQFKAEIQHSMCLNEVLAEIPREAILGIMICNTRLKSQKTALNYADKVKLALNLDLPIYHYNNVAKTFSPYPRDKIEQNLKISPIKIAEILRNDLLNSSYNLRFWGGKDYIDPNVTFIKRLPHTAHQIVTNLDNLLQEGNAQKISAELDNIENLLTTKINRSIKRTLTTVSSYETTLIQLKNR